MSAIQLSHNPRTADRPVSRAGPGCAEVKPSRTPVGANKKVGRASQVPHGLAKVALSLSRGQWYDASNGKSSLALKVFKEDPGQPKATFCSHPTPQTLQAWRIDVNRILVGGPNAGIGPCCFCQSARVLSFFSGWIDKHKKASLQGNHHACLQVTPLEQWPPSTMGAPIFFVGNHLKSGCESPPK